VVNYYYIFMKINETMFLKFILIKEIIKIHTLIHQKILNKFQNSKLISSPGIIT